MKISQVHDIDYERKKIISDTKRILKISGKNYNKRH